jgi:S1-C subfamily serine protease
MVRSREPGETVTLEIFRAGEQLELEATLGEGRSG